jgi:hypothetical protein
MYASPAPGSNKLPPKAELKAAFSELITRAAEELVTVDLNRVLLGSVADESRVDAAWHMLSEGMSCF